MMGHHLNWAMDSLQRVNARVIYSTAQAVSTLNSKIADASKKESMLPTLFWPQVFLAWLWVASSRGSLIWTTFIKQRRALFHSSGAGME